mgnify:CR=1 FL=1
MFKTILVPIDMAHVAEGKAIIDIAAQHGAAGAKIILLNVAEEIPGWAAAEHVAETYGRTVNADTVRKRL